MTCHMIIYSRTGAHVCTWSSSSRTSCAAVHARVWFIRSSFGHAWVVPTAKTPLTQPLQGWRCRFCPLDRVCFIFASRRPFRFNKNTRPAPGPKVISFGSLPRNKTCESHTTASTWNHSAKVETIILKHMHTVFFALKLQNI